MVVLTTIGQQKAIEAVNLRDYLRASYRAIGACDASNYPA
jgi:hypothetical protein